MSPQGVAKTLLLLTEGSGPLYGYGSEQTEQQLKGALGATVDAIDRGPGLAD